MDIERLGAFYLGRRYDPERNEVLPEPILYDAKDLTTHAVCVGMTGSGKTGLGITLLEEAAIDGIPIVAIDPKGDLGNLLLTFPKLAASDFEPWMDPSTAARKAQSVPQLATSTAELWRSGLAEWDQKPARIKRFSDACERRILTPGSDAGTPLNILGALRAPPAEVIGDAEALRERIAGGVAGLLGLLGLDADPLQSREHILLSSLFERAWRAGQDLDLATLIHQVGRPPIERVGVLDLETFFPAGERGAFAMRINNLLASPGFELWLRGEPLDAASLLYGPDGKPRISIISIAHLSDPERMFVVTQILNELVAWMRTRPGSTTLRALVYMDEVFGYMPPTANPPSKTPLLTMMKQARAFGLGTVLATQNPVDLDYKALSNAGTWFLGRLQTERDKARVLDGLEGAAVGARFDRKRVDALLSGLKSRVFLMNNVHDDEPVLFHTRWALSYLAGPMTREQIRAVNPKKKTAAKSAAPVTVATATANAAPAKAKSAPAVTERPLLAAGVEEAFLPVTSAASEEESLVYLPALLTEANLHYSRRGGALDQWQRVHLFALLNEDTSRAPWNESQRLSSAPELESEAEAGIRFGPLPPETSKSTSFTRWKKMATSHLYQHARMTLYRCAKPKLVSVSGESEEEFRGRVTQMLREDRETKKEKLRKRYAPKLARLEERIRKAEQRIDIEEEQYRDRKRGAAVSLGATVLGALFGRKLGSVGNVGRAGSTVRGMSRAAKERSDIGRAEANLEKCREDLAEMEETFREDVANLEDATALDTAVFSTLEVSPRKSDLDVTPPILCWCPFRIQASGTREAAFSLL